MPKTDFGDDKRGPALDAPALERDEHLPEEAPVPPKSRFWEILEGKANYGDGTPIAQATRFRLDHLLEGATRAVRKDLLAASPRALDAVDLIISVGGFSPETTILVCSVFRPKRLFVVSTDEAYPNIDQIARFLHDKGIVPPSGLQHERCDPRDPMDVFTTVRRAIEKGRGRSEGLGRSLVDITGGKKVMSAMAAQAGWEAGLTICYIDSTQDAKHRVSVPGSEHVVLLESPSGLAGHAQLAQAHALFDLGVYEAAREQYDALARKLAEPATARLMREVAALYGQWRAFDLTGIAVAADAVKAALAYPGPLTVPLSFRAALEDQLGFLRQLVAAERDRKAFVLAVYALAADYARRERYDFATLLYYRTLEGCFAEQLARARTIDVSAFDRGALGGRADDVEARLRDLVTKATGSANVTALPARIGCFEAFMLLRALDDPMMQEAKLWEPRSLGGLQRLLVSRNKSILAHGFEPVSAKSCDQFHAQAEHVLRAALNVWGQQNLEVELRPATFAQLGVGV